jgi:hypothetical protein
MIHTVWQVHSYADPPLMVCTFQFFQMESEHVSSIRPEISAIIDICQQFILLRGNGLATRVRLQHSPPAMLACFGLDAANDSFELLYAQNPFMFRIHKGDKTHSLIAKRFFQQSEVHIPTEKKLSRAQIIQHITTWTPSDSPWVSCTFSLPYVLWESHRRSQG